MTGQVEYRSRVLRGGSWNNDNDNNFRCANRNNNNPDNRNNNNGFRCASTPCARASDSTESEGAFRGVQTCSGWADNVALSVEYGPGERRLVKRLKAVSPFKIQELRPR